MLIQAQIKEIIKAQVTSEFPAQAPVTRKMFPFDDVIMLLLAGDGGFPHWCPLTLYVLNLSQRT